MSDGGKREPGLHAVARSPGTTRRAAPGVLLRGAEPGRLSCARGGGGVPETSALHGTSRRRVRVSLARPSRGTEAPARQRERSRTARLPRGLLAPRTRSSAVRRGTDDREGWSWERVFLSSEARTVERGTRCGPGIKSGAFPRSFAKCKWSFPLQGRHWAAHRPPEPLREEPCPYGDTQLLRTALRVGVRRLCFLARFQQPRQTRSRLEMLDGHCVLCQPRWAHGAGRRGRREEDEGTEL